METLFDVPISCRECNGSKRLWDPKLGAWRTCVCQIDADRSGAFHGPQSGAPETEREAAWSQRLVSGQKRAQVFEALLVRNEATPTELIADTGLYEYTLRPRLTELRDMGAIRDTGKRRDSPRGKAEVVWAATDEAKRWWRSR